MRSSLWAAHSMEVTAGCAGAMNEARQIEREGERARARVHFCNEMKAMKVLEIVFNTHTECNRIPPISRLYYEHTEDCITLHVQTILASPHSAEARFALDDRSFMNGQLPATQSHSLLGMSVFA